MTDWRRITMTVNYSDGTESGEVKLNPAIDKQEGLDAAIEAANVRPDWSSFMLVAVACDVPAEELELPSDLEG